MMNTGQRTLVASYQPYFVKVAELMAEHFNYEPQIWFVADENRDSVALKFPAALQYDFFDVVKGILPPWLDETDLDVVSPEELAQLAPYEPTFLYMLERNDSNYSAFEYKARLALYYSAIGLWKTVLRTQRIDMIVFEEEPHQALDYALFLTARLMNVDTLMTIRTISELGLLPLRDFEIGSVRLIKKYTELIKNYKESGAKIPISPQVSAYFDKLNSDYETVLGEHLWDQVEEYKRLAGHRRGCNVNLDRWYSRFKAGLGVASRFLSNTPVRSDQYKPGFALQTSSYSYREYLWSKLQGIKTKSNLRKVYESLATSDLSTIPDGMKTIYVALQYQPEKSTSPLAGRFVDQRYMVRLLSKVLGDGWHIFVKEHPSQFVDSYARFGECFRTESYYRDLLECPNVSLVSLNCDSFSLIDRCDAVASAGGTVCWEAAARGKPALSFAVSWFKCCHGIFLIDTRASLVAALEAIHNGFAPDAYLVSAFAQIVKEFSYDGAIGGTSSLQHRGISEEDNAHVIFKALSDIINSPEITRQCEQARTP